MKKKKKKRTGLMTVLILSCAALAAVCSMYFLSNHKNKNSTPEQPVYNSSNIPSTMFLNVRQINQLPELPTGCEITSLTQVLNFLGFDIDKTALADGYLDHREEITSGCFMDYFLGSPYDSDAWGCFAPALIEAANKYLQEQNSSYAAYNLSYSDTNALLTHVANGEPVIVWTSLNYDARDVEYQNIILDDTESFDWPLNEHCVVIIGYDLDKQTVTFADPMNGVVTRSIEDFEYFYSKYYYQAMVIR